MKSFSERVINVARKIPAGRVTTYGRIARAAGAGGIAAQGVTMILSKAEKAGIRIPWHRIVYADGHIWISPEYRAKRMKLYKEEGILIDKDDRITNFADVLFEYQ